MRVPAAVTRWAEICMVRDEDTPLDLDLFRAHFSFLMNIILIARASRIYWAQLSLIGAYNLFRFKQWIIDKMLHPMQQASLLKRV